MEVEDTMPECVLYSAIANFASTLPKGTHVLIEGELVFPDTGSS